MTQDNNTVKLSSKWTKFGFYFIIGFLVLSIPSIIYLIISLIRFFQPNIFFALILMVAIVFGCIYLLKNLTEGYIENNQFHLQKFRKLEKHYDMEHLKKVKVYENKREKYILATFDDGTGPEKYLFTNSKLFYAGQEKNTETVLKEVLENNKNS